MSKVSEIVYDNLKSIIDGLGYELYEVSYEKKLKDMNLTIFIDKENGIDINDCVKVHETINPILDELNPTNDEPYILNVSSLGLDRPLKSTKDFSRNLDKIIEVTLFTKLNDEKFYEGKLLNVDEENIEVELEKSIIKINRKAIAKAVLKIEF